jgi:uncharacterized membrane protein YbhN (UPF0104 family)
MAGVTASTVAETRPRMRDCREAVRELRASERTARGLHRLDRRLHAFWAKLPVRPLRLLATSALIVGAGYLALGRRETVGHSLAELGGASPGYVVIAVAAELASLTCYAALVGLLLRLGVVSVPFRALVSLTVIGIAMLNSLPGGQALSTIYWYQQLRRYRVQRSVAAFALFASTLIGIVTLVLLTAGGLAFGGGAGFAAGARVPVVAVAVVILLVSIVGRRRLIPAALGLVRRLGGPEAVPDGPARADHLLAMLALGFLNWLFDLAVLLLALAALGERLPLRGVVVAYALGQLVAAIPILPGGGGTVEATTAAGLVVTGGATTTVVTAVLLYRVIGAWGLVPLGWALWLTIPTAPRAQLEPASA